MTEKNRAMTYALRNVFLAICLTGCASSTEDPSKPNEENEQEQNTATNAPAQNADPPAASSSESAREQAKAIEEKIAYNPPAVADGYTRLSATTIRGIAAGVDTTHCEYVMAPVDRDMDILDVRGAQSKYGHHVVAFAYTGTGSESLHQSRLCGGTEFSAENEGGHQMGMGGFLGSSVSNIPKGAAFRLRKGEGIMLNMHYINQSEQPIDGDAYLDMKLVPAESDRTIATLFTGINGKFQIGAHGQADSSADCVVKSEVKVVMMANHMHEFGVHAKTEVVRADTQDVEVLRDDPSWTYEMQFNPEYNHWSVEEPFVIHPGDTLRTSCSWNNTTTENLTFPREMCISAGFVLVSGDKPTAPGTCNSGNWVSRR